MRLRRAQRAETARAAQMLRDSERPMFIVGSQLRWSPRRGALRGLGREISRAFMVRVDLAALTDGFMAGVRGAARDLTRTAFFFFITDPLYFRL